MAAAPAFPRSPAVAGTPPDYFAVFGLPRRFGIDRAALERRFYELSRESHPDRFAAAGADALRQAIERQSLLNEAYRVLKNPDELRAYFLRLERGGERQDGWAAGPATRQAKQQVPAELAESWFELQDAILEDPSRAAELLADFERELASLRARAAGLMGEIERAIDASLAESEDGEAPARAGHFERLERVIREQSYLASMERDVQRLALDTKARLGGGRAGGLP